jgi:hypothetical protein
MQSTSGSKKLNPQPGTLDALRTIYLLISFVFFIALTGKSRDQLAGGEVVEGAEAAGQLVGAQAAVAVERARELDGVAFCLQ